MTIVTICCTRLRQGAKEQIGEAGRKFDNIMEDKGEVKAAAEAGEKATVKHDSRHFNATIPLL